MLTTALALACLGAASSSPATIQEDQGSAAERPASSPPGVERLEEWPAVASERLLRKEITKLRKGETPGMITSAREQLVELGAGSGPLLLEALAREKKAEARERIEEVLSALCDARHTRLLALEFEHGSSPVRTFSLREVAATPDPGLRAAAEAAHARVVKALASEREARKLDPEEPYAAALCALSTGSLVGLEVLLESARDSWAERGTEIMLAAPAARGDEAASRLGKLAASGERQQRRAALRMLAGCGTRDAVRYVRPILDESDNSLRVAAINALRALIDGAPPLEKLSTFEAIDRANRWKQRL